MDAILLSFALALGSSEVVSHEPLPGRIGTIMVSGNFITRERLIWNLIELRPGQRRPSEATMLLMESRLVKRFGDRLDLKSVDGPLLEYTKSLFDGDYYDLIIHFPEFDPAERRKR